MNHFELEAYLNDLLKVSLFSDYAPNGIQIEGKPFIQKIATAVTASLAVIQKAIELEVDALFVHHGYFWKGENPVIKGIKKSRIRALLKHDINLFAYHLPLDAYEFFGNNASMGQRLDAEVTEISDLLWVGFLKNNPSPENFLEQLKSLYGYQVQAVIPTHNPIRRIAWCTGGAQDYFEQAIAKGVDAYITGEYSERSYHLAQESQVNFFAAGHHATEKDGIRFLGEHLSKKFNLTHCFIDEANPF